MSQSKQEQRIKKIRERFGVNAFSKFGKKGTSPILKAWKEGRVIILKNKPKSKG
jgi:hypothetical protein